MVSNINKISKKAYTLVFGLTADPIHKGHEQVIHNSYSFAKLNGIEIAEFLLLPTYQPNLIAQKKEPRTAFKHRFAMCEIVAEEMNRQFGYQVHVNGIEKQLFEQTGRKSYSFDTLKALDRPNQLFVLSADHFTGRWPKFRKWYCWQDLITQNGLLVHPRPGHRINQSFIEQLQTENPDIFTVEGFASVEVSSTLIRHQLANNVSPSHEHINKAILGYIEENNLYQPLK